MTMPGDKVLNPNGDEPNAILGQFLKIMHERGNPRAIPLKKPSVGRSWLERQLGWNRYEYKGNGWQVGEQPAGASVYPGAASRAIWLTTEGRMFYGGTAKGMDLEVRSVSIAFSPSIGSFDKAAAETIPEHIKKILDEEKISWRGPPELWILTDPKPWQESWRFSRRAVNPTFP